MAFGVRVSLTVRGGNCRIGAAKGDAEYDGVSTRCGRSKVALNDVCPAPDASLFEACWT